MTVGIEIAADHLVMVLVDLTGRVRADRSLPLKEASLEHIVPLPGREVGKICDAVPGSRDRLLGIGVVMPGPFDIEGMSSVGPTTLPGWVGKDPAKTLAEAIGISTLVENDATAAVGERLHGVARTLKNFCLSTSAPVLASESSPMGAHAGRLWQCRRDRPRDRPFGWLILRLRQPRLPGALRLASCAHGAPCRSRCIVRERFDLEALHAQHHPILRQWIGDAAAHLSPVVGMLENLLDPECIVFGGALPNALLDDLIAALNPLPLSVAGRRKELCRASSAAPQAFSQQPWAPPHCRFWKR